MAKIPSAMSRNKDKRKKRKKKTVRFSARKCRFCVAGVVDIDYQEAETLQAFLSPRSKILPRRFTGNCALHQRKLSIAIKRGRSMGLLPYLAR